MEKLNAEQVKKALECCGNRKDCTGCYYDENQILGCLDKIMIEALALINLQEQGIKELTEENERLKAQKYYIHSDDRIEMIPTVESVRADTVRKMQERLNKRFGRDKNRVHTDYNVHRYIDQIAKEMLEGVDNG